ncbi:MAG: threonylcarbamoyl-AMP synthase [Bacteroidales bacterium]|nr:threonylcarbamoyl-AMP synthase [Bacteroidales bacterium]
MIEADILKQGKILIYPTDTIWGIGCDALNVSAIERIKQIKGRDNTKSFILLMRDLDMIREYVDSVPKVAEDLLEKNKQENIPTTILYSNPKNLPLKHLSYNNYIGIRIPNNSFLQSVFKEFPYPIVSSSANFSGKTSPSYFEEIEKDFLEKADYVSVFQREDKTKHSPSSIYMIMDNDEIKKIR